MGRVLAIDYGRKRCGIAVTDPLRITATALATVPAAGLEKFLLDYTAANPVDLIVVGLPVTLRGEPSESMRYIEPALRRLRKALPAMEFEMWDERFTSTLAHASLLEAGYGRKQRQDKDAIDRIAATIILNSWLDARQGRP